MLVATSAFAQFAERTIKFTNGVNEDHPVGVGVKRMQEVLNARTGGKMKISAFWGGSAGRRPASYPGVARRYPGDGLHLQFAAGGHRQGTGCLRPAVPVRQRKGGRRGARWPGRRLFQQEARGGRPRQPRVLGERVSQPHQQQAPGHQGRGVRRHPGARDAEQHLPGHIQDPGHERGADGLRRGIHGARDQDHRRPGKPLRDHRDFQVQTKSRSTSA
jgi:hypothetical protein